MAQPDILVTAPLPPFLYEPLKADYRCHDYYQASHKPGLLAAEGARIRGLVQSGSGVSPTTLLDELPNLEIISVFGSATTASRSTTAGSVASRSPTHPTC